MDSQTNHSQPKSGVKRARETSAEPEPRLGESLHDSNISCTPSSKSYQLRQLKAGTSCLVLGDGDLSWSLGTARALAAEQLLGSTSDPSLTGVRFIATTFDSLEVLRQKYGSERIDPTIDSLHEFGPYVQVQHEVDATKLADHFPWIPPGPATTTGSAAISARDSSSEHQREANASSTNSAHHIPSTPEVAEDKSTNTTAPVNAPAKQFDRVVFNFPHWGGQGHIERNRKLLAGFFASVAPLLAPEGEVLVALKSGQGGTPLDVNLGAKANTWRVVELAHAAGLVCASVQPFVPPEGYACSGRRSRASGFFLGGALLHVFVHGHRRDGTPSVYAPEYQLDISFWLLDFSSSTHSSSGDSSEAAAGVVSDNSTTESSGGAAAVPSPLLQENTAHVSASSDKNIGTRHHTLDGRDEPFDHFEVVKAAAAEVAKDTAIGVAFVSSQQQVPWQCDLLGSAPRTSLIYRVTYQSPDTSALGKQAAVDLHESVKRLLQERHARHLLVRGEKARPAAVK